MATIYDNQNRALQENVTPPPNAPAPIPPATAPTPASTAATPIDVSTLSGGTTPFTLPPAPTAPSYDLSTLPTIDSLLNPAPTAAQQDQKDLQSKLLTDTAKIGTKDAAQIAAENAAGLPAYQKQLNDVNGQIRALTAEAAAASNNAENRLAPTFAIQGEQAQIERQRAVRALGLSAIAQTLQGNVALAQDQANKAVETQFAPVQAEIDYLTKALELNKDNLTAEEKKRAEALQVQLSERQRLLDQQKADKEGASKIGMIAAQFGAPSDVLNNVLTAPDMATAISLAGSYLQDPKAQYDLEAAKLDIALKQEQIKTSQAQRAQIGQPTATERKAAEQAVQAAQAAIPVAKDKIVLINSLLTSPGLNSSVGTNWATRTGFVDSLTGAKQEFIGGVQQLISKDTLDTLLNLKAQGGTLGALSDQERIMLQSAASKIGTWAVRDSGGNVTGYNVNEAAFKTELNTLKDLTQRALDKAVGAAGLVKPEERSAIESILSSGTTGSTPASINPASYF